MEVGSGWQALVLAASVAGCRVSVLGQDQAPASLALLALGAIDAFSVRLCRARYQGRPTALGSLAPFPHLPYLFSHSPNPPRIPTRAPQAPPAAALVYFVLLGQCPFLKNYHSGFIPHSISS